MGKAEDNKAAYDAAQTANKNSPLPRIGRMIVCVLTMGMAFPNAFSESVDIADYDARNNQAVKK
jgi:hypothetical protein